MLSVVFRLVADASSGNPFSDPVTTWVNFGILGLIVAALLTGHIIPKPAMDKLVAQLEQQRDAAVVDRDKAEAQRDAALAIAQEKLIPLLSEFTNTAQALIPILQDKAAMDRMSTSERRQSRDRQE